MTERDRLLEALRVARDRAMRPHSGADEVIALEHAIEAWVDYERRPSKPAPKVTFSQAGRR